MIKLKNVFKSFGKTEICNDITFTFREKGLTCLLGPSGSGKSTILNLIAGFDKSYSGEIEVNNVNLNSLNKEQLCNFRFSNIGFIFQNYNLLKGYTVLENVLMSANLNGNISDNEKTRKILELLKSLGIEEKSNEKIEYLSGGQKQRVAIARALINEPKLILADEPTGALDRENTEAIMNILKGISNTRQVVMISHDESVVKYADEVIELEDGNIKYIKKVENEEVAITDDELDINNLGNTGGLESRIVKFLSLRNFKIHKLKYLIASIIIAFGTSAFVASLSTKNITNNIINDFKSKNSFYNIGNIPLYFEGKKVNDNINKIYEELSERDDLQNVYYQYDLENIKIKNGDKEIEIPIKIPTVIAKETMAYGNMPREGKKEIAISSNVANRITDNIKDIIGKKVMFEYLNKEGKVEEVDLTVSGLTNSQYQDFILSSDIEKKIYENANIDKENKTSISFEVKEFNNIPKVDEELKNEGIGVYTKGNEVQAFQKSFSSLLNLYTVFSYLILIVGVIISAIILYRITIERYTEIGVLGAIGYTKQNINKIIFRESIYFASISTIIAFLLIFILDIIYKWQFGYGINVSILNIGILIILNLLLTIGLSGYFNNRLIKTETAEALRK